MSTRNRTLTAAALLALALSITAARAQTLPSGFEFNDLGGPFTHPVGVTVAPDGRVFVIEQAGIVKVFVDNALEPQPFINLTAEVGNSGDRGLLGIALDPNFLSNRLVYLLYTRDDIVGQPDESEDTPLFGRLTRYAGTLASGGNIADPSTRTVLMGAAKDGSDGPPICSPSHTIGALAFGLDGSLFVSVGDGADFVVADGGDITPGCTDEAQDIGSFRSQMLDSLAGKMLRVSPVTGLGLSDNPFFTGNAAEPRSKVWASGLRNPFRFCVRPGSPSPGTLLISDVGWNNYEEINVARRPLPAQPGPNFGWPCYEGPDQPLFYPGWDLPDWDCATMETPSNPGPYVPPILWWAHGNPNLGNPQGFVGVAAISGEFYTGASFPPAYQGVYFYADFNAGWIRGVRLDANDAVTQTFTFATGASDITDIAIDPVTGDMLLVSKYTNTVRRISFTGKVGDTNNDVIVGIGDLLAVIGAWGPCTEPGPLSCPEDITIDGVVGIADLLAVIGNWG